MNPLKQPSKAAAKRTEAFQSAVLEICRAHGGVVDHYYGVDRATVGTVHGPLIVTPFGGKYGPWIALRFSADMGRRVYSELHGRSFNESSGKWNIHLSGGSWNECAAASLDELRLRLAQVAPVAQPEPATP